MKKIIFLSTILFAYNANAQLVVQSGATITTTGNAVVCLLNTDLQNDGTINQLSGTGKFVFNGNANSIISGTTTPNFAILEMAKTGNANLTLQQHIGITENVLFTSGSIELNNKNILLQPTATLIGETETSRITGLAGGYVEITNTLNAPTATNVGNLGATITSSQNLGSTTIRRGHTSQTGLGGGGSSIYRYFDIIPTNNTALNATLRINYFDAELNAQTEVSLVQYKSPNNLNWSNMGFTTRDGSLNYVEKTGLNDFSRWTLSNLNNTLPVSITQFSAGCSNGNVTLLWKTAQEQNSKQFNVQTSTDGITWVTIATVPTAGNSTTEKQYTYTNANTNNTLYRIMQVDLDGKFAYTTIVKSVCNTLAKDAINIYPNPAQQNIWIALQSTDISNIVITIVDVKGATVLTKNTSVTIGNNVLPITLTGLAKATYTIIVSYNNGLSQKIGKLIKQ